MTKKIPKKKTVKNTPTNIIQAFKSGKIYDEIDKHFKTHKSMIARQKKRSQQIDALNKEIRKKERDMAKLMNEIIRLKNKMSGLLHKQLEEKK